MSMTIEILESVYYIDVETAFANNISTLDIETSTNSIIEINSDYAGTVVFASDITGLDDYLANFIDNYEIDCGTP
jgi:hypothetical protein